MIQAHYLREVIRFGTASNPSHWQQFFLLAGKKEHNGGTCEAPAMIPQRYDVGGISGGRQLGNQYSAERRQSFA